MCCLLQFRQLLWMANIPHHEYAVSISLQVPLLDTQLPLLDTQPLLHRFLVLPALLLHLAESANKHAASQLLCATPNF
jgi:hypothetical protein